MSRFANLNGLYRYLGAKVFTGKMQQGCIAHLLSMTTRTDKGFLLDEELLVYLKGIEVSPFVTGFRPGEAK